MVLLSALLSKNENSATVRVLDAVFDGKIISFYHRDILAEYDEVLHREKFHLQEEVVRTILDAVRQYGIFVVPQHTGNIVTPSEMMKIIETAIENEDKN